MQLRSPPALHYPITVTQLLTQPQDLVRRSTPIFRYTFNSFVPEDNESGVTLHVARNFPAAFESGCEGKLVGWKIKAGSIIDRADVDIAEIEEPCRHDVQFGGMCASCGKDLTGLDYNTSVPDTQRADTGIAHVNNALKISKQEAGRIDEEAKQRLLKSRKLSLVVDLDLTIIHASVDPTIGDWQKDESNPNHEALQDVKTFELWDEALHRPMSYYIKLRPGLQGFLERISHMYEMHIYTMATRSYAKSVARIIDHNNTLFGDRIMSRSDTPGEEGRKDIQKLFPVDNKMVVIIDDRADVWSWSKYLVRVKPFNFFVGIGDINSSFNPKREDLAEKQLMRTSQSDSRAGDEASADPTMEDNSKPDKVEDTSDQGDGSVNMNIGEDESTLDHLVSMHASNDSMALQRKTAEQDQELAAQVHDRPLLQQQKLLEEENDAQTINGGQATGHDEDHSSKQRQNLLQNDDTELQRVEQVLTNIHKAYFDTYGAYDVAHEKAKKPSTDNNAITQRALPDVKDLMDPFRTETLRGCSLVFSGVIPLNTDLQTSHFVRMAVRLGATVESDITSRTTHLIARKGDPTEKMRQAAKNPRIQLVSLDWLWESSSNWWTRIDEGPYRFDAKVSLESNGGTGYSVDTGEALFADPLDDAEEGKESQEGTSENNLLLETDIPGRSDDEHEETSATPVDALNEEDWEAMNKEIEDLSESSDEGSQYGNEGDEIGSSSETESGDVPDERKVSRKKRKREQEDGEGFDEGQSRISRQKQTDVDGDASTRAVHESRASIDGNVEPSDDTFDEEDPEDLEAAMREALETNGDYYEDGSQEGV